MKPDVDGENTGDPPVAEEFLQTDYLCSSEVEVTVENAIEETNPVEIIAEEEIADNLDGNFEDTRVSLNECCLPTDSKSQSQEISVKCSSIKIGGYEYTALGPLVISSKGVKFFAPSMLDSK